MAMLNNQMVSISSYVQLACLIILWTWIDFHSKKFLSWGSNLQPALFFQIYNREMFRRKLHVGVSSNEEP